MSHGREGAREGQGLEGLLALRRTWTRQRLGPTKTGLERAVSFGHPILESAGDWRPRAELIGAMTAKIRRLKRSPLDPTGFLFTQPDGRPWGSSLMNYTWRRALAQVRVRYRPAEQLRHTVASTLLSRGAPLLYVQAVGGWRSVGVLLKTHSRWMDTGSGSQGNPPQPPRNLARARGG